MKAEILTSIQEWLKPIRQQMEANTKSLLTQTMSGGSTTGLMSQLLKSTLNAGSATGAQSFDPAAMRRDLQLRGLFTRIKYANITRKQRDALSTSVRNLAAEDRLDGKAIGKIYQMVGLIEAFGSAGREKNSLFAVGNREKTADEEMDAVYSLRDMREKQKDRLNELQSRFSTIA